MTQEWPRIDYLDWRETCSALHLYLQIVGKYRLAHTPWLNHSWHATFYVDASGLTTSLIPDGPGIEIAFDLISHKLIGKAGNGRVEEMPLGPPRSPNSTPHSSQCSSVSAAIPPSTAAPTRCPIPCRSARMTARGPMTPRR